VDWVRGAKDAHSLDIDWVGDWNEDAVDWDYNIVLRAALDAAGFHATRIVASDQVLVLYSLYCTHFTVLTLLYSLYCTH
jgi:hypothetical protein